MANLSSFRVDSRLIETGEWIRVGDEYDDLEVYVKGFTDEYTDYRAAKLRRAAAQYSGDATKIPALRTREIMVDALNAHVVMDVRNLSDENGNKIDIKKFKELLRNPDYADLVLAVLKAASQVGTAKKQADAAAPTQPQP